MSPSHPEALRAGLRQLLVLRCIALAGQATAIAACTRLGVDLPVAAMVGVLAVLAALNVLAALRLRSARPVAVADLATHIAVDLSGFTVLLFLAGGTTNPFTALYVLHGVLMALLLPPRLALAGVAAVLALYVALGRLSVPMLDTAGAPLDPGLLAHGEAIAFALAAAVTAWFVARVVAELRRQDGLLAKAAQRAQRDEAVLRVGALAAGAAHELSTPLTTMAVLAGEIGMHARSPQLQRDAEVLSDQIRICRETIAGLLAAAGHAGALDGGRERLDRFLESVAARCRAARPEARITCEFDAATPAAEIFAEQGLRQALLALLNNAVDESPGDVRLACARRDDELRISVSDRGPGLPATGLDKLGRAVFTTKPRGQGAGIGLLLATRTVERLGGTLGWTPRSGGGMCAEVVLPWQALSLAKEAA